MNAALVAKADEVNTVLAGRGADIRLVVDSMFKNGGNRDGVIVRSERENGSPIYYPSPEFYTAPAEKIADQMQLYYDSHMITVDIKTLCDAEHIRSRVLPRLFSAERISEMREKHIVCVPFIEDVIAGFYIPTEQNGFLQVTEGLLFQAGLSLREVLDRAVENLEASIIFRPLHEVLSGMTGEDYDACSYDTPLWVLTTEDAYNGAAAIMSKRTLRNIADRFGTGYYILPSSIHEVLILKDESMLESGMLHEIVSDINESVVLPEDRLADQVMYYSKQTDTLQTLF